MTRQYFRWFLAALLLGTAAFTVWTWMRPYAWKPDPGAGCRIIAAGIEQDRSFYWLNLRLRVNPGKEHDLRKPIFLETAAQPRMDAADTTLSGAADRPIDEIFLRFWLDANDLEGPLKLHLNEGALDVRTGSGVPRLGRDGSATFPSRNW